MAYETLQDELRACQQDMLQNSPDHILHPAMIEECNKIAKLTGKDVETPNSVPKAKVTPNSIEFHN